jgi:hypothetical protein
MTLFTKTQTEQLIANCQAQIARMNDAQPDLDFKPVVKIFTPDAQYTWLLTEMGLDNIAFGLCDLGMETPELGYVSMQELRDLRGPLGLPVERDEHFDAYKTISANADEARALGGFDDDIGRLATGATDFVHYATKVIWKLLIGDPNGGRHRDPSDGESDRPAASTDHAHSSTARDTSAGTETARRPRPLDGRIP